MPRTVKSAEERRLEIIQTSERLFRENGYASTSVDAIIKEMGVAKGTFYYYFKSKEEVLPAIVDHTLDQIVAMVEQVIRILAQLIQVAAAVVLVAIRVKVALVDTIMGVLLLKFQQQQQAVAAVMALLL